MRKIFMTLVLTFSLFGDEITIFSASSTKDAMREIVELFEKENKNSKVKVIFGSSGKGFSQLSHGFPFDLFFSADSKWTEKIYESGKSLEPKVYANGLIAIYSKNSELLKKGIFALRDKSIYKIAVANPKTAPYGALADNILEFYKLTSEISSKIVMGDNISQTVQFVDSGNADIGLVALSLVKNRDYGDYVLVNRESYKPLQQAFVITKNGAKKELSHIFAKFILSPKAKNIFQKYGFE
jgi:molybdate transport system substrate-binding protein